VQDTSDAEVTYEALSSLLRCRNAFLSLAPLVQDGKLPDAVVECRRLEGLLDEMPEPLAQANVMADMKVFLQRPFP
jgi:hypothetical protein